MSSEQKISAARRFKLWVIDLIAYRLPPCEVITEQLSRARLGKLSLKERILVRLHLTVCDWCTNYKKQIGIIDKTLEKLPKELGDETKVKFNLPDDAKKRILSNLKDSDSNK